MRIYPRLECNLHLMLWYLPGKWKVVGGPFCGVGVLLKKVPWHEAGIVVPPSSSYSTDLASVGHTRPYQTSVWQPSCCGFCWERSRSVKLATVGLAPRNRSELWGHRPDHMDQRITGEGFEGGQFWYWQYSSYITDRTVRVDMAFAMITGLQLQKMLVLLFNHYKNGIED